MDNIKLQNQELRYKVIGRMLEAGADISEVTEVIKLMYIAVKEDWDQGFIDGEVLEYYQTHILDKKTGRRGIQREVEKWVESNGSNKGCYIAVTCSLLDCYSELEIKKPEHKIAVRMAFKRLCEKGKLEPTGGKSGTYRILNSTIKDIDFMNADTTPYPVRWPLNVHEYVEIYRKSLVVIAGEPNAGKSAFCLNTARKNKTEHEINYFSSEMGAAELQIRLKKFSIPLTDWCRVHFKAKSGDFKDVIDPDGFNIIDYLEVSKDFYEIGGKLTEIFDRLDKGIAVVAIQKPKGRETGIGGERTLDKARLYLSIEPGILKIVKGKLWRQDQVNPNGMYTKFTLGGGANFKQIPDNKGDNWRRA